MAKERSVPCGSSRKEDLFHESLLNDKVFSVDGKMSSAEEDVFSVETICLCVKPTFFWD